MYEKLNLTKQKHIFKYLGLIRENQWIYSLEPHIIVEFLFNIKGSIYTKLDYIVLKSGDCDNKHCIVRLLSVCHWHITFSWLLMLFLLQLLLLVESAELAWQACGREGRQRVWMYRREWGLRSQCSLGLVTTLLLETSWLKAPWTPEIYILCRIIPLYSPTWKETLVLR